MSIDLKDAPMADGGNTEIMLVRMESKLDRISDRLSYYENDQKGVKERLHTFGNALQGFNALQIDKHFTEQDKFNASTDVRLHALEADVERRKGAMGLAKVLWMIFGGLVVGGAAMVARVVAAGVT